MTRTKKTKRKKTHQNGDAPVNKKVKEWISDPISIGLQGFSISYDRSHLKVSYYEVVSQVTQLLDVYADRIYRTDEKTCTIKHRLTDPESSLIFVETDMEDPAVLVDAIYTDLLAPRHKQCDDVKNARHWSRVFPVQMICTKEYEDLMSNAKALLKPILEEDGESKIKILHYGFKGGFNLFEELMEYLGSKGLIGESDPDIGVVFRACGTLCLISVIRNYAKYRKYCIRSINNKKSVDESSKPQLLTSDGATKPHLLTSDGATKEDRLPKVQEEEQQTIPEDQTTVSDQIVKNDQAATNGELAVYGQVGADDQTTATDQTTIGNQTSTNDETTKADQTVIDDPMMKTDQIATSDQIGANIETVADQTVMDDQTEVNQMTTSSQTFTGNQGTTAEQTIVDNQGTTAEQTVVDNETDTADVTDTNGETKQLYYQMKTLHCNAKTLL